ncbi:amidohydrolase family protein [Brucella pseudogrignonensis]|uniref:amidohydrolase family protein n=1 Tax=Brucella pseudogrignonensis TaxID=419475 RepID=UPI00190B91E1|nr:amidohydrolase family protein [Brucella pseudogrignonensis]MBK0021774.1 amidohydrolase family protein [Ochrobactrum sp. S45]MBK0043788.1 amidohydrolase family protein [Ochrobactrum sp. S46]UKK93812.1 amidohydrolase family protein [Brucella pseudogrignonensis]
MKARSVVKDKIGNADLLKGVAVVGRSGHYDISIDSGRIASLTPSQATGGGFITPLLADVHVHLDKTFTIGRIAERGSAKVECLFDAIDLMNIDRESWNSDDIRARATHGLEAAYARGVGAMRTHVDWITPDVPTAWPVLNELRQEWKDRIDLELAALIHSDIVLDSGAAIAQRVAKDGGVLGAFFYRNADLEAKIEEMFRLAVQHDLKLDFHVDEGLELEADGFSLIVAATKRHNMGGRVLCGHACSLSLRSAEELSRILDAAADAGTALVSLPTSNLYLQDRLGGKSPRLRGVAPLKEARRAGMDAMLGSDNVRDAFYPYGDYDPLSVLRLAAPVCHLEPDEWLDSITTLPARFIGSDRVQALNEGGTANFIWHDATDINDLISRPQTRRVIWRDGTKI